MDHPPHSLSVEELQRSFVLACLDQTEGRLEEAREKYLFLLGFLPESAMLHYNIGLLAYSQRDFCQALQAFTLAITLAPEDVDTLFNLALCQKAIGDCEAAITSYRQVLKVAPDNVDCLYNLAGCYRETHEEQKAITCYHAVLALDAAYLPAANNLAYLYHRAGNVDQAVLHYQQVLASRPDDESVRYLLDALQGAWRDHAPESYVEHFFDTYAEGFEHSLVGELGYDNPRQLYDCFLRCPGHKALYDHGLDLGCGTGLSGLPFVKAVKILDGVDLSRNMLTHAARKGCYARLYPDSILHHLVSTTETYDFFLATDVFIYVGDLLETFTVARSLCRPAALFCFSTEYLEAEGYCLQKTGRFAYSRAYVRTVAEATGWTVLAQEKTRLRKEATSWITGDLWILQSSLLPNNEGRALTKFSVEKTEREFRPS